MGHRDKVFIIAAGLAVQAWCGWQVLRTLSVEGEAEQATVLATLFVVNIVLRWQKGIVTVPRGTTYIRG